MAIRFARPAALMAAAIAWGPVVHAVQAVHVRQAQEPAPTQASVPVHVVGNGWHAGILLPAAELNRLVPELRVRFPQAEHYEVGWGDVGFYQAQDITARLVWEALFASQGAVLHVVGLPGRLAPFLQGSEVASTCVTPDAYRRMAQAMAQAFARGDDGKVVSLRPGIYGDGQFYKAVGSYGLFYTCNRWTATVLAAGGLSLHPRLSLTAGRVLSAVRAQGQACATPILQE
ncbi:MAG: hypothetical protein RI907_3483 [Pseudomonadota bacterium]|jgi:uncharacterized protein (TIGR02117 family)